MSPISPYFPIAGAAVAIAAAAYLWSRSSPTSSVVVPGGPNVPTSYRPDAATYARNQSIVMSMFGAAGIGPKGQRAAWVNAVAESAGNNLAVGDSGHSVGLFQIHDLSGARTFTGDRKDPVYNTRWILDNEVLASAGLTFRTEDDNGASVSALAAIFARDIERPADIAGAMARRAALAIELFGEG